MKVLVCTDGSEQGQKAVREATRIVKCYTNPEVTIIYVHEPQFVLNYRDDLDISMVALRRLKEKEESEGTEGAVKGEVLDRLKEEEMLHIEKKKKMLVNAARFFEEENIKVNTVFKEGHPAQTIAKMVSEEGYAMVIMGSRGVSGLKRLFLGSVSNAVLQEVRCNVLIVK